MQPAEPDIRFSLRQRMVGHLPLSNVLLANLAGIGLSAAAAILVALTVMITSSFGTLEEAAVHGHVRRTLSYLDETSRALGAHSKDWGYWDDTYRYIADNNPGYEYANINAESLKNALFDGMVFVRFRDLNAHTFYFDRDSGKSRPDMAKLLQAHVTTPHFQSYMRQHGERQSYVRFGDALYAIASVQVKRSDLSGEPNGYLTVIQKLDQEAIGQALQIRSRLDLMQLASSPQISVKQALIDVAVPILDRERHSVAMVRFSVPRDLLATGAHLRNMVGLAVLGLVLAMMLMLNRRITALVLKPVESLSRHVNEIRATGELKPVLGKMGSKELGELQQAFNAMAEELAALRAQNEMQSFALGKQQSSIGVMHNVRNSLSPVHVILATLDQKLAVGIPVLAERALGELGSAGMSDERREKLAAYLKAVHAELAHDIGDARIHVREAGRHLQSTLEAISASHRKASDIDYHEPCELAGLLGYASNSARFTDAAKVRVRVDCPERIVARGNRVLLVQILENLVINAVESIVATGSQEGEMELSASLSEDGAHAILSISDTGEGFDPALSAELFRNGYSTRHNKSGGMGLHWCANTINAMGGSLSLTSAGPGQGARATITLHLHEQSLTGAKAA